MLWLLMACALDPVGTASGDGHGPRSVGSGAPSTITAVSVGTGDRDPASVTTVDVVVVGGGPAGLMAAIAAHEDGVDVLVLEREDQAGGSARWASSLLFAGTDTQAALGVWDSPDALLDDWADLTGGGDPDVPWVQRFAEEGAGLHDWLVDRGVDFNMGPTPEGSDLVARTHTLERGGESLVAALVEALPPESLRTSWEVLDVRQEGDGATIEALGPDGLLHEVHATAVVMATGGFLSDMTMVAEALPGVAVDAVWTSTGPWADGAGHRMLRALGGTVNNLGTMAILAHGVPHPDPDRAGQELMLSTLGQAVWVNEDGVRFIDESDSVRQDAGRDILDQPGQAAWAIFEATIDPQIDGQLVDVMADGDERRLADLGLEDLIAAGHAAEAPDLEGLAHELGIDAEGLVRTGAEMHERVRSGLPDPWRGGCWDGLNHGPFVAVRLAPALGKAFGGMDVDDRGAVVDADGNPIHGFYAAGELTGMAGGTIVGDAPFAGSLSAVLLSGRVAGLSAAAAVR